LFKWKNGIKDHFYKKSVHFLEHITVYDNFYRYFYSSFTIITKICVYKTNSNYKNNSNPNEMVKITLLF